MIDIIERACDFLSKGLVVAIPTETVYGLAADSTNDDAIASIYEIKNRPTFNPLIAHVSSLEKALNFGIFNDMAIDIASKFWNPGTENHRPLTIVVRLKEDSKISKLSTAGLNTIGIRVPNHKITNELLKNYHNPLSAPSANLSKKVSATNPKIVEETLGDKVSLILDGGQCEVGIESTIIDMSYDECQILRFGGTSVEDIESVIGYKPIIANHNEAIKAPGMLKKHYSPSLPLIMNQSETKEGVAYIGFGENDQSDFNLSKSGDLKEAAANLFKMIYDLDDPKKFSAIYVAPIPMVGLGLAINDRLSRAAASE